MRRMIALLVVLSAASVAAGATAQDGMPSASPASGGTGGKTVEIVLEPRPGRGAVADGEALGLAQTTLERRLDLLEVDGATVEVRERRIVVAVPAGVVETETLLPVVSEVGLLEIVDPAGQYLEEGTLIATSLGAPPEGPTDGPVYATIVGGDQLADAFVTRDQSGVGEVVGVRLDESAAEAFLAFTTENVGRPMSIVVDKRVVSTPTIQAPVSDPGIISGVAPEDVRGLVVRLGSGPLPMPLAVVSVDGEAPAATPAP